MYLRKKRHMAREVIVLRYGHRVIRDERVTSHCCLVARALGAQKIIIVGERDKVVKKGMEKVTRKWGGKFKIEFTNSWTNSLHRLKKKGFIVVHLTMYGLPISALSKTLENSKKIVLVIGSKKVERRMFEKSDYNVSVTSQPHSEIAALAIVLDRVFSGKELGKVFRNAKIRVIPSNGKKLVKKLQ
jgi:tRNA (cytidine56-2'-O)-methyltransferase